MNPQMVWRLALSHTHASLQHHWSFLKTTNIITMPPNQAEAIPETPLAVSEASGDHDGKKTLVPMSSNYTNDNVTDQEMRDIATILTHMTQEEIASFPDDHMPLRHLRAEKVSTWFICCVVSSTFHVTAWVCWVPCHVPVGLFLTDESFGWNTP